MGAEGTLRVGDTVDKYVVESFVGRGGMGAVYGARHAALGRRVALKWMLPSRARDQGSVRRFLREARALGGIHHPNVVDVLDCGVHDGSPFLVMELLAGSSLRVLMTPGEAMDPALAVALVVPAMQGVQAAHTAGVLHRDLKPENLFVVREGSAVPVTKVLDLGLAKLLHDESVRISSAALTGLGAVMGTPAYMSPEQVAGTDDVDVRTDVWSLGVILYELLAGRRPYPSTQYNRLIVEIASTQHDPLASIVPDLPGALTDAVETALSKPKSGRFPDVRTFARAIARLAMPSKHVEAALRALQVPHQRVTSPGRTPDVGPDGRTPDDDERLRAALTRTLAHDEALAGSTHSLGAEETLAASPHAIAAEETLAASTHAIAVEETLAAPADAVASHEVLTATLPGETEWRPSSVLGDATHASSASTLDRDPTARASESGLATEAGRAPPSPSADPEADREPAAVTGYDLIEATVATHRPSERPPAARGVVIAAWIAVIVAILVTIVLLVWTLQRPSSDTPPARHRSACVRASSDAVVAKRV